jgi:hypothetical protein
MMRRWWIIALVLLAPLAQAVTVNAFLDRSQVSLGDTVTLNIKSDGAIDTPDLAPLQKDFQVLGSSRSSSVDIVNGKTTRSDQLGIALKPLHAGTLTIPALSVGGALTQPLALQVGAAPAGGTGKLGDPAFMQASVLSSAPYVGQQTVYTVRMFYLPGVSGSLGDPTANGARLIKLDRDHDYTTERDGYAYKVLERSWALIPTRRGAITVQGPAFQGQRVDAGSLGALLNNPNALLNGHLPGFGTAVNATAPVVDIDAQAEPANAGKPWLPARAVQLHLTGLPANGAATAGVPLTVTLSIGASGQPADALPEPELPALTGARVYPDQTQDATADTGVWLQGTRTRSFAIVPERNGALSIPAITLAWWNVTTGRAEEATVPAHTWHVTGGVAASSSIAPPVAAHTSAAASAGVAPASAPAAGSSVRWRSVALASFALWLAALVVAAGWWWRRRGVSTRARLAAGSAEDDPAAVHGDVLQPQAKPNLRALQANALAAARAGDAPACERALLAWARGVRPSCASVAALRDALSDPAQRAALDALQRARWQGGDAASACPAVAQAFARGFAWRDNGAPARPNNQELPPLYPPPH